jgi:hypothetical protein
MKENWAKRSREGNRDIRVPTLELDDYPRVRGVVEDPTLEARFTEFDCEALGTKYRYHTIGLVSLGLGSIALLAAVMSLWTSTTPAIRWPGLFDWLAFFSGLIPLCLLYALGRLRWHERWLGARFCAERIRHWRYHQFLDGALVESASVDQSALERGRDLFLAGLSRGAPSDAGARERFVKRSVFQPEFSCSSYTDPEVFFQAMKAYKSLRLDYQTDYFTGMEQEWSKRDAKTRELARGLLILAIGLACVEGLFLMIGLSGQRYGSVLAASALVLAILSMTVRVYRSGSAMAEETERYASRSIQLSQLSRDFGQPCLHEDTGPEFQRDVASKLDVIGEVERVCWLEFVEFMRTAEKSDYFI